MDITMNNLEKGVIVTDSNGVIKGHNALSEIILETSAIIGRSIGEFSCKIESLGGKYDITGDQAIYIFGDQQFDSHYHSITDKMSVVIFSSDPNGRITYRNHAFSIMFPLRESNLFRIFEKHGIKIKSFDILNTAKKDVVYDVTLTTERSYRLHLIPAFDENGTLHKIFGYFIEKSEQKRLSKKIEKLEKELSAHPKDHLDPTGFPKPYLQMKSNYMDNLDSIISNVSNKDLTILLLGKSGTGKSALARRIHERSLRASKPFVTVNCTSLPENLIESELFGYEKGAFTGASASGKRGLIDIAESGTLFIDEIGEIPLFLQGKLLELLQEKTYRPVGSTKTKKSDVRIIVATNRDLLNLVAQKKFREDLYYRIAVAIINLPPLSERPDDVQLLINAFVLFFNKKYEMSKQIDSQAKEALLNYHWPGNIRELEHTIEFLMIRSEKNTIMIKDLPNNIVEYYYSSTQNTQECPTALPSTHKSNAALLDSIAIDPGVPISFDDYIQEYEAKLIRHYYSQYSSSYKVADKLKISQTKANRLIRKYCK